MDDAKLVKIVEREWAVTAIEQLRVENAKLRADGDILNEVVRRRDAEDAKLRAALQSIISHWDEFGYENGFDEIIDIARARIVSAP